MKKRGRKPELIEWPGLVLVGIIWLLAFLLVVVLANAVLGAA